MTDYRIEFIFGDVSNQLKQELRDFWTQHGKKYQTELQSFREAASAHPGITPSTRRALSRQPAAIARDENQNIIGIVFVALRELDAPIGTGSHAYFQRMFIAPQFRSPILANQLYRTFLAGFDKAASERDQRAHYLMTENINPGLQKPSCDDTSHALAFAFWDPTNQEGKSGLAHYKRSLPFRPLVIRDDNHHFLLQGDF